MMNCSKSSKTSAGGVIFKKEKTKTLILLIQDNWSKWTFAKGFVEPDETYRETAIREMTEELGIDAKKLKYVGDLREIEYDYVWRGEKVHKRVYYYLYEWVTEQKFHLQKKEGIKKFRWVPMEKLEKVIGYKEDSWPLIKKVVLKLAPKPKHK